MNPQSLKCQLFMFNLMRMRTWMIIFISIFFFHLLHSLYKFTVEKMYYCEQYVHIVKSIIWDSLYSILRWQSTVEMVLAWSTKSQSQCSIRKGHTNSLKKNIEGHEKQRSKLYTRTILQPKVGLTFLRPSQSNKQSHRSTNKRNVCSSY